MTAIQSAADELIFIPHQNAWGAVFTCHKKFWTDLTELRKHASGLADTRMLRQQSALFWLSKWSLVSKSMMLFYRAQEKVFTTGMCHETWAFSFHSHLFLHNNMKLWLIICIITYVRIPYREATLMDLTRGLQSHFTLCRHMKLLRWQNSRFFCHTMT